MKDTHDEDIDIDKYDKLPDIDGVDLDADNDNLEDDSQGSGKKTEKNDTNDDKQKPGTNFFKQHNGSKSKFLIFLVIIVLVIILVCGYAISHMGNKQQAPGNTPVKQSLTTKNGASSKFKAEIKPITTAQQDIQDINNSWRNATVNFAKKQDIKAFKKELMDINDQRIEVYNRIKDNKNALVKPILATSDAIHSGLVDSYALTKNSDYQKAIKLYNNTNKQVTDNNREYKNVLIEQLTKRHIQYTTNKTDDGWTVDY